MKTKWNDKIFNLNTAGFESLALEVFQYQYAGNRVYRAFVDALDIDPARVTSLGQIPFLPIRFFKSHSVLTGSGSPLLVFESSGTTGMVNSRHAVADPRLYEESFRKTFGLFYGSPADWCIIGLLPSYLERSNSSLVYMVNDLIHQSNHVSGGFYLDDFEKLSVLLRDLEENQQPTLLIGVTFALLDFAEACPVPLRHTTIMETGGMKGRRREMIRAEVHERLKNAFATDNIHSEYGMTELLSQAYSQGDGRFQTPPWMRIVLRDDEDPLQVHTDLVNKPRTGAINVIDLANIHSCSFIATDDAARMYPDGSFEVLGRMDHSDVRGCSLLSF